MSTCRPVGWVNLARIVDSFGKEIPFEKAIKYGWLTRKPGEPVPTVEEVERGGPNMFTDQGRQLLTYAFAFRSPIENYTCSRFGIGTGTTAAKATDIALEAPITLNSGLTTGPIDTIDFLSAFVMRVAFTLGLSDANGYLISEQGLFSGNNSLFARQIRGVGINKTSDFAPTLTWRLRF